MIFWGQILPNRPWLQKRIWKVKVGRDKEKKGFIATWHAGGV
jgi:hypothetical protein